MNKGERSEHSGSDRGCGSEQHHEQRRMMRTMGRAPGEAGRDGFPGSGPQALGSELPCFQWADERSEYRVSILRMQLRTALRAPASNAFGGA